MSCPTYRLVAVRIEIERALRLLMISRGLELQRSLGVGRALRELRDSGGVPSGTGALCAGCLPAKLDHPPNISRPGQIQCVAGLAGIKYTGAGRKCQKANNKTVSSSLETRHPAKYL